MAPNRTLSALIGAISNINWTPPPIRRIVSLLQGSTQPVTEDVTQAECSLPKQRGAVARVPFTRSLIEQTVQAH
jgi:hypothetical protein